MSQLEEVYVRRKVVQHALINGVHRSTLPEYRIWTGMLARCSNPNAGSYRRYGGRGIRVCARWREDFANFYEDMGPRPSARHSVDRWPDRDGDYEPGNCRWATPAEQAQNKDKGAREDAWTDAEMAELERRYKTHEPIEAIALAIGRSPGTVKNRVSQAGFRRSANVTRHLRKHPDLRHVLTAEGEAAFLVAVSVKRGAQKRAAKAQKQAKCSASERAFAEIISRDLPRNEMMRALRLAGFTLDRIGRHFSLTRERVRQLQEKGFPPEEGNRRAPYRTKPHRHAQQVNRLVRAWNSASVRARAAFLAAADDPHERLPSLIEPDREEHTA